MAAGRSNLIQGSAAFNLWKKFEWMSTRLRKINKPPEIEDWIAAMTSVHKLMLEVGKNTEVYKDGWRPRKIKPK